MSTVSSTAADHETLPLPDVAIPGRWLGLSILTLTYMLNFVDRQMLALLIEPVKRDIHLTDTQIGLLTGTLFAICYSLVTLPIAMLADRTSRIRIVAAGCFVWSLFVGFTGFATNFLHLAIARIGLAFGEAGGVAPSISILSDYFPPRRRVVAMALYMSASPFGVLIGTTCGGLVAASLGWRATFHLAAIIGLVTVPILLLSVKEPVRGTFDPKHVTKPKPTSFGDALTLYLRTPSLWWLAIAAGLFGAIGNALVTWMPALLMRSYGMEVRDVALYYGPLVGVGLITGTWSSAIVVNWLSARSIRSFALVPALALFLSGPLFGLALVSSQWQTTLLWLFVPIALSNFTIAPTMALVQELSPPDARSTVSAILMLVLNLFGIGVGPLLIGAISDVMHDSWGSSSLRYAMLAGVVPMMIGCALSFYIVSRNIKSDLSRARATR